MPLVRTLIITAICFFSISRALCQKGLEIGPSAGVAYYFGDLNSNFDFSKPGLALGLNARYNFNNRLCLRMAGTYGRVHADDLDSDNSLEQIRGINFSNNIIDVAGHLELNFLPYLHGSFDYRFTPFMFVGAGMFFHNPKAEYEGRVLELNRLRTEGQLPGEEYQLSDFALNYGIGIKYSITYELSINVELSFRQLYFDYLDDVSTVYPNASDLEGVQDALLASNPSSTLEFPEISGTQRGRSEDNDSFHFLKVSFVYYLGGLTCPDISEP